MYPKTAVSQRTPILRLKSAGGATIVRSPNPAEHQQRASPSRSLFGMDEAGATGSICPGELILETRSLKKSLSSSISNRHEMIGHPEYPKTTIPWH